MELLFCEMSAAAKSSPQISNRLDFAQQIFELPAGLTLQSRHIGEVSSSRSEGDWLVRHGFAFALVKAVPI